MRLFKILPVIFTLITNFCFAQSVVYRIITDKPLTKLPFEYAHKSTKVSFPKLSNDQIQEFTDVYSREESGISRITIVIKKNGKKFRTVELEHPDYNKEIIELEKIEAGITSFVNVSLTYSDKFMTSEYDKIKNSVLISDFDNYITKFYYSPLYNDAIYMRDSLELELALSKESEQEIDIFIKRYPNSPFLDKVKDIKEDMVHAREDYQVAKESLRINEYESFLKEHPNSILKKEAIRDLLFLAESEATEKHNLNAYETYLNNYLVPYFEFLSEQEQHEKSAILTANVEIRLKDEFLNVQTSDKLQSFSNFWIKYISLTNSGQSKYFKPFNELDLITMNISDLIFMLIQTKTNHDELIELNSMIQSMFPNLYEQFVGDNPVFFGVFLNLNNASGIVKIQGYNLLEFLYNEMFKGDLLKETSYFEIQGQSTFGTAGIDYQELEFSKGKLTNKIKGFNNGQLQFIVNFPNRKLQNQEYYAHGELLQQVGYHSNGSRYVLDFIDGINLTLLELDNICKEIETAILSMKTYVKSNEFDSYLSLSELVLQKSNSYLAYCKSNNLPENITVNQRTRLDKSLTTLEQLNDQVKVKQQELQKKEDQKRLLAQQKAEQERQKNNKEATAQLTQRLNEVHYCHCCPNQFVRKNGWTIDSDNRSCYRLMENGEFTTWFIAGVQTAYLYGDPVPKYKFCSKRCALSCGFSY